MKVNLKGLFANVVADCSKSRRKYNEFCLGEVYGHIQDVIDGKHTIEEFADHYCIARSGTPDRDDEHGELIARSGAIAHLLD